MTPRSRPAIPGHLCFMAMLISALDNVIPADGYFGRQYAVLSKREKIKRITMRKRKEAYLAGEAASVESGNRLLAKAISSPKAFDDVHHAVRRVFGIGYLADAARFARSRQTECSIRQAKS